MSAHLGHASSLPSVQSSATGALGWSALFRRAVTAAETRLRLRDLDEHMLRDIGMTRQDALQEASRAPWYIGPDSKPQRQP